jgi:hypothetical protein
MELGPANQLRVRRQGVEDHQTGGRSFGHGDRDGPVGLDDRRRLVRTTIAAGGSRSCGPRKQRGEIRRRSRRRSL